MNKGKALCAVATVAALACAAPPPVSEPADGTRGASGVARIEAIDTAVTPDRTRVVLVADAPLLYTSYEPDATTLVIEVQNVDVSALPPVVAVDGEALDEIRITHLAKPKDFSFARLEFMGLHVLDYTLRSDGTNLVLDFLPSPFLPTAAADLARADAAAGGGPGAAGIQDEPVPAASPAAPAPADPAPSRPTAPASRLLEIDPASVAGGVRVALRGDGAFRYRTFTLENPDRLVLDLIGVRNTLGSRHLTVAADPVDQVRVAQFRAEPEPVARVVLDLVASVPYRIVEGSLGLDVVVGEGAVAALPPGSGPAAPEPAAIAATAPPADAPAVAALTAPAAAPGSPDLLAPAAAAAPGQSAEPVPAGEVPLSLEQMGLTGPDDGFVLFDQAAQVRPAAARGTIPPQFQATTIAGEQPAYTGERISLHFVEADLKNVFLFFSEFIGLNIVIDPEVSGALTMHLDQVPWDQAFDVILRHQGLEKIVEGNVVRIATTDKLRAEAAQRQALKQAQEQEVDPVTFTKVLSYAKVGDVAPILTQGVRTDRGRIVQDDRTNTLIITDVPSKRDAYQRLIDVLDTRTQQVMIEARIVETDRNFEQDLGINWSLFASADPSLGTQTDLDFPNRATLTYDVNLPAAANAGTLGLSLGNVLDSFTLDIALQAFENEGKVRILSSPKITTQNNQTATIEQGTQIPVVTTTAVEINVQYISASLRLQVTPQITAEETVIMDVVVENNSPDFVNRVGDVPPIITERAQTQILVHDGSTAVIGGIFKLSDSKAEAGIPGLRKIPLLGWLFKNRAITKQNTELLVFITPKIVKSEA